MRKVVMATLALSPMLLHAQANTPAQPQQSVASPLRAELSQPKEFSAAEPTRTTTSTSIPVRVSTGVVTPKLIHVEDISTKGDRLWTVIPMHKTAVVNLVVDAEGKPTQIKLVNSFGKTMDQNIVEAVSQYRFQPGTVSNHAVASPLTLELNIHNLGL